eukprot:TRINITY_DN750_c0_g1_i1.p3 TRINITY_DN750_c0_g1~~TRINITY_DN750_c0_g1_i1.p3  ORF type:complete len:101 (-),score=20.08 TRINITY_DN750_c0_g1_i1:1146-1448(-)
MRSGGIHGSNGSASGRRSCAWQQPRVAALIVTAVTASASSAPPQRRRARVRARSLRSSPHAKHAHGTCLLPSPGGLTIWNADASFHRSAPDASQMDTSQR